MAEPQGDPLRRIGMRTGALGILLALSVSGCCDESGRDSAGPAPATSAPTSCLAAEDASDAQKIGEADLDGDGQLDSFEYAGVTGDCGNVVTAVIGSTRHEATLEGELPVDRASFRDVVLGNGRHLVLVRQVHPRGGFQAHLFGYADGAFEELTVDGEPIFAFVATDTNSSPLSASCVDGGFAVSEAAAHEPIGVVPAWDVFRTTYAVDGNAVSMGPREEIADNVLDTELETRYRALTRHRLFEDCRADRP